MIPAKMFYQMFIYLALSILFSNAMYVINYGPKYPATNGEVWPSPQYQRKDNYYYTFNPSRFVVKTTQNTCNIITSAIERYSFIIRNSLNPNRWRRDVSDRNYLVSQNDSNNEFHLGRLTELDIELKSPCEDYPYFGMDESYDLRITTKASLSSNSVWGILRGLETWTQLFYFSSDYNEVRINQTHIMDFPRYAHRGLLLDTSRHFISLSKILKTLDAMAANKMNVFHWHIVDDQSFPYQSEVFPELSRNGAYHPTMIYSKQDIQLVVSYARDRGIRVLPEFDVPGHTRSWGASYPNILTECYSDGNVIGLGPMDPTKNATYLLLEDLIKEIQQWFPDKYFHFGGDEVELDCWKSNPNLRKYMRDHNLSAEQLHALFMENVLPLLGNRSNAIVWQEVFDEGVPLSADTIVQVWKWEWEIEMIRVLNSGHKLIFSSSWYLDHLQSGGDWVDFYMADPRQMVLSKGGNTTLVNNIVGGEACMWGEVVDDTNVISRVWPRASATAERLWSAAMDSTQVNNENDTSNDSNVPGQQDQLYDVRRRLEEHTCRMRRRGIPAQPPNGPGFCVGAA